METLRQELEMYSDVYKTFQKWLEDNPQKPDEDEYMTNSRNIANVYIGLYQLLCSVMFNKTGKNTDLKSMDDEEQLEFLKYYKSEFIQ